MLDTVELTETDQGALLILVTDEDQVLCDRLFRHPDTGWFRESIGTPPENEQGPMVTDIDVDDVVTAFTLQYLFGAPVPIQVKGADTVQGYWDLLAQVTGGTVPPLDVEGWSAASLHGEFTHRSEVELLVGAEGADALGVHPVTIYGDLIGH